MLPRQEIRASTPEDEKVAVFKSRGRTGSNRGEPTLAEQVLSATDESEKSQGILVYTGETDEGDRYNLSTFEIAGFISSYFCY